MSSDDYERFYRTLEELKKVAPNGADYWHARSLQPLLEYTEWENFEGVILKAIAACESANAKAKDHFRKTTEMVFIGSGAKRPRADWVLSRYACYTIAMNADPTKKSVGHAQAYFAIQTRLQELGQARRLKIRLRVIDANKNLNSTARRAGVERFPLFHDGGYRGLYGGRGLAEIKRYKGLPEREDLLDHASAAELAANEFRITQTDEKINRERIKGEDELIRAHRYVGQEVRASIDRIGGTMPEDMPPEPSIKRLVDLHRQQVHGGSSGGAVN